MGAEQDLERLEHDRQVIDAQMARVANRRAQAQAQLDREGVAIERVPIRQRLRQLDEELEAFAAERAPLLESLGEARMQADRERAAKRERLERVQPEFKAAIEQVDQKTAELVELLAKARSLGRDVAGAKHRGQDVRIPIEVSVLYSTATGQTKSQTRYQTL